MRVLFITAVFLREGNLSETADDEDGPAGEETEAAEGGDGAQPARAGVGEQIEAAAEEDDADQEERPGEAGKYRAACEEQKDHGVNEVVKDGLFPYVAHVKRGQMFLEGVGAKCAERDGKKTNKGGDADREDFVHDERVSSKMENRKP